MGKILETILHGQKIGFHPQRVLLLPDLDAMLVADIHLGKAEFMQGKGIPLSNLPHQKDHERLVKLIKEFQVKQLFILGDLVHRPRQNPQSLQRLIRDLHPLAMEVHWIQGNHDGDHQRSLPDSWKVHSNALELGPFVLRHQSLEEKDADFQICGHVHPCVKIGDGRDKLRLPCFALKSKLLLLPSFGELTGGYELLPQEWETFVLCLENEVSLLESSDLERFKKRS